MIDMLERVERGEISDDGEQFAEEIAGGTSETSDEEELIPSSANNQ